MWVTLHRTIDMDRSRPAQVEGSALGAFGNYRL
jgi:hypothetical protein